MENSLKNTAKLFVFFWTILLFISLPVGAVENTSSSLTNVNSENKKVIDAAYPTNITTSPTKNTFANTAANTVETQKNSNSLWDWIMNFFIDKFAGIFSSNSRIVGNDSLDNVAASKSNDTVSSRNLGLTRVNAYDDCIAAGNTPAECSGAQDPTDAPDPTADPGDGCSCSCGCDGIGNCNWAACDPEDGGSGGDNGGNPGNTSNPTQTPTVTPTPTITPTPTPAMSTYNLKGAVDVRSDCSFITGWACDMDDPGQQLTIKIYRLATGGQKELVSEVVTDQKNDQGVNMQCGVTGGRNRFTYKIPQDSILKDGTRHSVVVETNNARTAGAGGEFVRINPTDIPIGPCPRGCAIEIPEGGISCVQNGTGVRVSWENKSEGNVPHTSYMIRATDIYGGWPQNGFAVGAGSNQSSIDLPLSSPKLPSVTGIDNNIDKYIDFGYDVAVVNGGFEQCRSDMRVARCPAQEDRKPDGWWTDQNTNLAPRIDVVVAPAINCSDEVRETIEVYDNENGDRKLGLLKDLSNNPNGKSTTWAGPLPGSLPGYSSPLCVYRYYGAKEEFIAAGLRNIRVSLPGGPLSDVISLGERPTPTPRPCLKSTGDANCDGYVNRADFGVWMCEYMKHPRDCGGKNPQGTGVSTGSDFDGDSVVTLKDFVVWRKTVLGI